MGIEFWIQWQRGHRQFTTELPDSGRNDRQHIKQVKTAPVLGTEEYLLETVPWAKLKGHHASSQPTFLGVGRG